MCYTWKEKRRENTEKRIRGIWNSLKWPDIHAIGVLKEEEREIIGQKK